MKKYIIAIILACVTATVASAGVDNKKNVIAEDTCVFRDNELQLDLFGSGLFYKNGRPGWGGGLGVNYFFARYFGIGIEQGLVGRNDNGSSSYAEWNTLGSLYLRYPICSWNLAPYATVGGGAFYGTSKGIGVGFVGGGAEYRINDTWGVFADCRWLYTGGQNNDHSGAVLSRVGVKVAF